MLMHWKTVRSLWTISDCWLETFREIVCQWPVAETLRHGAKDVEKRFGEGFGRIWIRGTACVLRTASTHWNVPGKYGPHGGHFFFLLKEEPMVLSELVEFGPWFSAETVKACALIGLHMMPEENSKKYGLGRPWPRRRFCEHTVDDLAIEVVGQHWTSEAISLSTEDWEVGRVPSSCHLSTDLLCQEMRNVCKGSSESLGFLRSLCSESQRRSLVELSAAAEPFSHRGRAVVVSFRSAAGSVQSFPQDG